LGELPNRLMEIKALKHKPIILVCRQAIGQRGCNSQ
jgi:hypothetical protein